MRARVRFMTRARPAALALAALVLGVAGSACNKSLFAEEDADLPTDLPLLPSATSPREIPPPHAPIVAPSSLEVSPGTDREAGAPVGRGVGDGGAVRDAKSDAGKDRDGGEPGACGDPPLAPCPLQAWMKAHTGPDVMSGDLDALTEDFERIATFAPVAPADAGASAAAAGFDNWVSIAKDGADAARAASMVGVRGACRGCHHQYKDRYRAALRPRPLPLALAPVATGSSAPSGLPAPPPNP